MSLHPRCSDRLIVLLLLTTTLVLVVFSGHYSVASATDQRSPVVGVWSGKYRSSNITDTKLRIGSEVTVDINVTNTPAFNAYEFWLFYDPSFLLATSIDVKTGTVFSNPFVVKQDLATPGTVRLVVVEVGGAFSGANGTLVHVNFKVIGMGVSPLTLAAGTAEPSTSAQSWTRLANADTLISVTTTDGYFKNVSKATGPVARFTFSPVSPTQGQTVIFDAMDSFDPDNSTAPNKGITKYDWNYGDQSGNTTFTPFSSHEFASNTGAQFYGNFSVRLTVTDSDDKFEGMKTLLIEITPAPPPLPDFNIETFSPLIIAPGSSLSDTIQLRSLNGFAGNVSQAATVSPLTNHPLKVSLSSTMVTLEAGATLPTTLTVSVPVKAALGAYTVNVTGTSGSLSHSVKVTIIVTTPHFEILAPGNMAVSAGFFDTSPISLVSVAGFAGNVSLSATISPAFDKGPTLSLNPPSLQLSSSQFFPTSSLKVSTVETTPLGFYTVIVTGTSGKLSSTAILRLLVTRPDFTLEARPSLTLVVGSSVPIAILATNRAGTASVSITSSISPVGPSVSLRDTSLTLLAGQTMGTTLTISTDDETPVGNYTITVLGTIGSVSQSVSIMLTLVKPLEPVFAHGFHWSHRLDLFATDFTQTWTARVANPSPNIDIQVIVRIEGVDNTGRVSFATSTLVFLHAGETRDITIANYFLPDSIGLTFSFTAAIQWGVDFLTETSSSTRTGTFRTLA